MAYVDKTLTENENIISSSKFHWWYLAYPTTLIIITLIGSLHLFSNDEELLGSILLFGALWETLVFFHRLIARITTEQVLTNKRIFLKTGLIRRDTDELIRQKVETISIKQSILGRILGFGEIEFTGTGGIKLKFTYVSNPTKVKKNYE